ncbi:MAG TPA: hypothetical protein PKC24_14250 [Cyclobacteriaceae bacterium]|nr:hypothetical protein [Cyclobacteriaceae bacterium]
MKIATREKSETLSRYFIAIIPPEPVYTEALSWKHFFAVTCPEIG